VETEPKIVEAYVKTGRVKLIFRHILDYGSQSLLASQAAECAGDQAKFWEMHELLFQRQDAVFDANAAVYKGWAANDLKLEVRAFASCLDSGKYKGKVEGQHAAAKAAGVRFRPTFEINGKRYEGALTYEEFQKIFDAIL
jgi:protein-disulfide isomerase